MAKTGRPNFVYICQGNWRGITHKFQIIGNTTGAALSAADAKIFMEGTASPYAVSFAPFQDPAGVEVIGTRYYNGTASAPVYEADYTPGEAPTPLTATGTAFETSGVASQPLEVCVMLEARVGTSSTGKPVFCRKFIRGASISGLTVASGEVVWEWDGSVHVDAAASMGNGNWYNNITYCSPSGATADSAGWTALAAPGNHQVPRGRKRKSSSSKSNVSLAQQLLNEAIALGGGIAIGGA